MWHPELEVIHEIRPAAEEHRGRIGGDAAHRGHDVRIRPAAAQGPAHPFGHFVVVELWLSRLVDGCRARPTSCELREHPDRRADLPWGAVTALERVVVQECLRNGVQRAVVGQAIGGDDLGAVVRDRQCQAGQRAASIDQHRAGTALAVVAALLRAHVAQPLAAQIQQRHPGVHHQVLPLPVDAQAQFSVHDTVFPHACTLTPPTVRRVLDADCCKSGPDYRVLHPERGVATPQLQGA